MPNFDFDTWSQQYLATQHEAIVAVKGEAVAQWVDETRRRLEFARYLVQHGILTEFPGVTHEVGVTALYRSQREEATA